MSLYSLLDDRRFVGCSCERELCACFSKEESRRISLFCLEENGEMYLVARRNGQKMAATALPLPAFVKDRMLFWNAWATEELQQAYDSAYISVYGLVAYAISIAVDIAAHYPDAFVDYCGFPVYDEWATREYALAHWGGGRQWDEAFPRVPVAWQYNNFMRRLIASAKRSSRVLSAGDYVLRHACDYGISRLYYDPAVLPECWFGHDESINVDRCEGFPEWVVRHRQRLDDMLDWTFYDYRDREPAVWEPLPYLIPFLEDALSVDVARFMVPLAPVSSSSRFVTGEVLLSLIQRQRRINETQLAFHQAVERNDTDTARRMIAAGADVNASYDEELNRPLIDACYQDREACVRMLVDAGADVNLPNKAGLTPLHGAVRSGNERLVRFLLQQGAALNHPAASAESPLHLAALYAADNMVRLLLEAGANPHARDASGKTALDYAIEYNAQECIVLLKKYYFEY